MTLPLTISKEALEHPAMDYDFLRREGLRILERLGGQLWTDFNAHDPGITILEQLCYAITDLAYRANYDIKDLLASGDAEPYRSLFSPAQILTTHPVTILDLRKLVIDVPGVKNAWFEPIENTDPGLMYDPSEQSLVLMTSLPQPPHREPVALRGIYRVLIEIDSSQEFHPADILPEVNHRLHASRGLGEDFTSPVVLPGQGIIINAGIEVSSVDDPERLLAEVYYVLDRSISPRIHFHTLAELLEAGRPIDEIMDGPALQHGFIDDAELEQLDRKSGLRASDLIQEIMAVDGVLTISSINIFDGSSAEDWYLNLDPLRTPFLDIDKSLFALDGPTIRLLRGGIQVQVNPARVREILNRRQQQDFARPLSETQRDIRLPVGKDRNITRYYSIQHQFPETYGIGAIGLPESASDQRKAQAKQLKAFLLFFDQLLANYFAQLGNARELFSFYGDQSRSYFSQVIEDASLGLEGLRDNDLAAHAARLAEYTDPTETGAAASADRKNRFLNHLLARFAEQFTDYSLLLYAHIDERELLEDKNAFLRDYQQISAARCSGLDYTQPSWDTENVSGLEKRISRKLGIASYRKRDLAGVAPDDAGGFHMLEHLLLRPSPADKQQWAQLVAGTGWQADAFIAEPVSKDPYSQHVSFIFPKWIARFAEAGFSDLVEKTLREETPARIHIQLHWLEPAEMLAFESAYKTWLENVIATRIWNTVDSQPADDANHMTHIRLRDARDRMVQILGLGTPYPLRDLPLVYPGTVSYNRPAAIQILGGQGGVLYQLCDEDGNPIPGKGNPYQVQPDAGVAEDQVYLPTPAIVQDIAFTVRAIREDKNGAVQLEAYLNQIISIKVGIDTLLPVAFSPADGQVASDAQIIVGYGDKVSVTVSDTQEGISYRLITGPSDAPVVISGPQKGNQSGVTLVSTQVFNEDTQVNVLAYRTASSKVSAILNTTLTVLVRPNPGVAVNITPPIIDYKTASLVTLVSPQITAEYYLFKRELTASEYLAVAAADSLSIKNGEGGVVFIQPPAKITNWDAPDGFNLVGVFKDDAGVLSAATGDLLEDTIFIIQATKLENHETLGLDQAVVVLVRPDTAPPVAILDGSGPDWVVTVDRTQQGVGYQLRLDAKNQLINPPGYHLTDRGVETVRLEVDLVVEGQGQPILLLPAGAVSKSTTFNVLAIKTLSGVSSQLDGKVTIDVPPPPGT